jgi:hypothetical protein
MRVRRTMYNGSHVTFFCYRRGEWSATVYGKVTVEYPFRGSYYEMMRWAKKTINEMDNA